MTNVLRNSPAGHSTCARRRTRVYTDEPLMRSDMPVLIFEVVRTLSAQQSTDQATVQSIIDCNESSLSRHTH